MLRDEPADITKNLQIFQWLYEEAVLLGALPPSDPLDGIDVDIRIARVVNGLRPSGKDR